MKTFIAISLLLSACTATSLIVPDDQPGRRIYKLNGRAPAANPVCVTTAPVGYQCADDCLTLMTCIGTTTPVFSQTCIGQNAKNPYCVNGGCTNQPNITNPACGASGFTCTGAGVFPDPSDCTKYHICTAAASTATSFQCGSNYVFNSKTLTCSNRNQAPCNIVDCTRVTNAMTVYWSNPAYYAFCLAGAKGQIIMYKCKDELNEIFDTSINKCRYNCKAIGNYVDRSNCSGYVTCSWVDGRWVSVQQSCPTPMQFKNNACVPQSTPACTAEITDAPITEKKD